MKTILGLTCGLVMAGGLAQAQPQQTVTETRTTTTGPAGTQTDIRRVTQLIGSNVHLQGANDFGKVEDVVLNNNGGVDYLVVNREGPYAMLPYEAAQVNYGQRVVNYDVAPTAVQPLFFERNAWPDVNHEQFGTRMRTAFPRFRAAAVPPIGALPPAGAVVGPDGKVKEKVKVNERTGEVKEKVKVKP